MPQFIIRADDLGYCQAVNYAIAKTVHEGLIRSVGLMPNMPDAAHGLALLAGADVCLGQHTNVCLGKPCADPALIPSLLDANGDLHNSKAYRAAWKEGREFTVLEEMVTEVEAQYHRFVQLAGRQPDYFECHAVVSKNLTEALRIVAARYGLPLLSGNPMAPVAQFCGKEIAQCPMGSMLPDYDPWQCLKDAVANARTDIPNMFVCHPGYLDAYLLRSSSPTVNRTKEVEMLCDPAMARWLAQHDVECITYREV